MSTRVTVAAPVEMISGRWLLMAGVLMPFATDSMMQSAPEYRVQQQRRDGDEFAKASQDSDPLGRALREVLANSTTKVKRGPCEIAEPGCQERLKTGLSFSA